MTRISLVNLGYIRLGYVRYALAPLGFPMYGGTNELKSLFTVQCIRMLLRFAINHKKINKIK